MYELKRVAIALLIVLVAAGSVFATGDQEDSGDAGASRFSFAIGPWDVGQGRIDVSEQPDNPSFQYVEEQAGAAPLTQSWDWEGSTGYVQGLRLALAGGEEFAALSPWTETLALELIEAGRVVPLTDLIPQYPNVQAYYSQETWDIIREQQGGEIWYIPQPAPVVTARVGMIRKDWLDRVGLDVPTTKDELLEVYRAFRDQDANGNGDPTDEIPVSGRILFRWFDDLFVMHGVSMYEGHPQWRWNEEEGFFESDQVSDEMLAAVQFLNELYEEGLMDVAMPAQENSDWSAKIADDRVGHYFHLINEIHNKSAFAYQDGNDSTGIEHWTVMPHPPIVEGVGRQNNYFPPIQVPRFLITTDAEDPEAIMEWLNWSASSEGQLFSTLGLPGVNWERDGAGNISVIEEKPFGWTYALTMGEVSDEIVALQPMGEMKVDLLSQVTPFLEPTENMLMPGTIYDGYEDFFPNSATMYREMIGQMITGAIAPTEANWEAYREEWYAAGGRVVTDRATEWYNDFYGN